MKVGVFNILKHLKIRIYSLLVALIEVNKLDDQGLVRSRLEKHLYNTLTMLNTK